MPKKKRSKPSSATPTPARQPTRSEVVQRMRRQRGQEVLPEWAFWRFIHEVKIWEGVALWCDLEPRQWTNDYRARIFNESQEFKDRLLVAIRSSHDELPRIAISIRPEDSTVALSQFAAWALSKGWPIPDELAALGITPENDKDLRDMLEARDRIKAAGETPSARKVADVAGYDRNSNAFKLRWKILSHP